MNLYEHTIIARQDTSPSEIKQLTEKYSKIIEKNQGEIIKTENWGLLNLSYLIKKNKKGSYIHFKIKGKGTVIGELEKNEAIDKKLLRYLTVKVSLSFLSITETEPEKRSQGNEAGVRGTDHPRDAEVRDPPGMHGLPMMNRMSPMKRVASSKAERELED